MYFPDDKDEQQRRRNAPVTIGQGIDLVDIAVRSPQFKDQPWKAGVLLGHGDLAVQHLHSAFKGTLPLTAVDVLLSGATAPRGQLVQKTLGGLGGGLASAVASGAGFLLAGPAGAIAAGILADPFGRAAAENTYKAVLDTGRRMRRLNFGDGYEDSEQAYTMRARAAQELSGSLLNARQYLGKEAVLLHQ